MGSSDLTNSLGWTYGLGSYAYSTSYVGIIFNDPNNHNAGFTTVTSGPNTALVDAIVGRGSGNAWDAYETDLPPTTDQGHIDAAIDAVWTGANSEPFTFSGTYTYSDGTNTTVGSGNVVFASAVPVPLPASVGVGFTMLAGFGAMFAFRKRLIRKRASRKRSHESEWMELRKGPPRGAALCFCRGGRSRCSLASDAGPGVRPRSCLVDAGK